ncbi:MAG: hypothetical protein ACYC0X_33900 [Pirellulaceae bacterium]
MATSIQVVGDKTAVLPDLDVLVLLRMMSEEVMENDSDYPSLQSVAGSWKASCDCYGLGTLDMKLDMVAANALAMTEFVRLLRTTEDKILTLGSAIPASLLNDRWGVHRVTFSDYSTSMLSDVIAKIRVLLI